MSPASTFPASLLRLTVAAALIAAASCTGDGGKVEAPPTETAEGGRIAILYEDDAIRPENRQAAELLRDSGVIERIAGWVEDTVVLRRDLEILVSDDMPTGIEVPTAELDGSIIYLPVSWFRRSHEVLEDFIRDVELERGGPPTVFEEEEFSADNLMVRGNEFILGHEMGHTLIHQLMLPVTGLEEDAVDGFAAFYSINALGGGRDQLLGAAALFDALASGQGSPTLEEYASDHALTTQRAFNFVCFVVGSDPARLEDPLVEDGYLPESRAPLCPFEWAQLNFGWRTTLEPHLTEEVRAESTEAREQALQDLIAETEALSDVLDELRRQ